MYVPYVSRCKIHCQSLVPKQIALPSQHNAEYESYYLPYDNHELARPRRQMYHEYIYSDMTFMTEAIGCSEKTYGAQYVLRGWCDPASRTSKHIPDNYFVEYNNRKDEDQYVANIIKNPTNTVYSRIDTLPCRSHRVPPLEDIMPSISRA